MTTDLGRIVQGVLWLAALGGVVLVGGRLAGIAGRKVSRS